MKFSRTQHRAVAGVLILGLGVAGCSAGADPEAPEADPAAEPAEGIEAVCEAAQDEEPAEAWMNFGDTEAIVEDFAADYPDVAIEPLVLGAEDGVPRIITEMTGGGTPSADVVYGNLSALAPLIERDLLDDTIDWEGLDVDPEFLADANTVRVALVGFGLGYNTEKYSPEDLPDTWDEVIDEKWRGKVILDPRGRPYSFLSVEWGKEETVEHVTRLLEVTDPIIIQGTTAGLVAVASGEGDLLLNSKTAETEEQVATGAPLGFKALDIIPTEGTSIGVLKGADSPNGAQCFTAWLASEAGAASILEHDFKTNSLPEAPEGAKVISVEGEEAIALSDETIEELSVLISGGEGGEG
jgi:iron(III) transport system substrate-binding protein